MRYKPKSERQFHRLLACGPFQHGTKKQIRGGVGLENGCMDVIQALKLEPRIMRYELTEYE